MADNNPHVPGNPHPAPGADAHPQARPAGSPRVLGGRYEVGELIGRGGMAEVHIGHDARLGRTVAIKILRSDLARDPSFLARFRREAQAAAALNHPAIVAVYDTGEDTYPDPATGELVHVPYIVMEYVEGHTVREILNHGDAVPIDEAVEITSGVLSALEYSHHAGIIHRDIKPGNVMITPTGAVKVMDFGIARAVADSAATMTQTQAVIGTAQYLSPEQARGETVDARSDVYSTGCLLFELLTGRPPFVGDSPVAVAYQHVGQTPVAPSEIASDVPADLDHITLKALAKERGQRYASAADFRADLESFLVGQPVAANLGLAGAAPSTSAQGGATQVFSPGAGATQVFGAPASPPPADGTQVLGAASAAVTAAPPVFEAVLPPSHAPAPAWGPLGADAALAPFDAPVLEDEPAPRSKVWLWVLLPLLIIGVGVGAFLLARGPGDPEATGPELAYVPTFTEGITQVEACSQLMLAGFICNPLIDTTSSAADGTFLRQEPLGGTELEVGEVVTVWFSGGPMSVPVPDLTGMTLDQARDRLAESGLEVGEVTQETSPDQPTGNVTRTHPAAGWAVDRGEYINVYLSNGLVDLPNVVNMSQDDALALIADLRLLTRSTGQPSATLAPGTVISQSPAAGQVEQGTLVVLTIAEEPAIQMLTVPSVVGQQWSAVAGQFEGFVVPAPNSAPSNTVPQGAVISTNPAGGTQLASGSTVTVVVSSGPEATPPPPPPEPEPTPTPTPEPTPDPGEGGGTE